MKVAIYARVSTEGQDAANQLNQLRDYCQKSNYEIFKEYVDIISGKEDKRPEYDLLFYHAHRKLFDMVLFWDLSRFSRSGTLFTLQKLKELENLRIGWHSYSEPYFSTIGAWKDMIISVMATIARIEREKISERTKAGLVNAKNVGKRGKDKKERKQRKDKGIKRGVLNKELFYLEKIKNNQQ